MRSGTLARSQQHLLPISFFLRLFCPHLSMSDGFFRVFDGLFGMLQSFLGMRVTGSLDRLFQMMHRFLRAFLI